MTYAEETLPLYRHRELYEFRDEYTKHKFFRDEDFEAERRLFRLEQKASDEFLEDGEPRPVDICEYRYAHRYCALDQTHRFAKNLMKVGDVWWESGSYSEFVLKCEADGISGRKARFFLLYHFFCPGRLFMYEDVRKRDPAELEKEKARWADYRKQRGCMSAMEKDYFRQVLFHEMRREAFAGKRHDCADLAEFVESDL